MDRVKEVSVEYGCYRFKLEKILHEKNISMNRLMKAANTDFKVIQRLRDGILQRIDLEVLDRICAYLECDLTDIIEYIPNKVPQKEEDL